MRILKQSKTHQTAVFVVLEPDSIDRNGDIVSEDVIIDACHEFMINIPQKAVNFDHEENTDTPEAQFVENYILPSDFPGTDSDGNDFTLKAGSWLVGIKFSDALWEKFVAGEFTGISLEGTGEYL